MNKNRFFYFVIAFLLVAEGVIWYFNISLTSLPTTFKEMIEKQISQDEQLVFTEIDTERIKSIRIEPPLSSGEEEVIEDKDVISTLLNNELRIYNGGRFEESNDEYDLYINFYGSVHRYTIAKGYIKTLDGNYKVLDENNEVFNYLTSLYEELK